MPIFEYRCGKCEHEFDDLVPVADRDDPRACPACGAPDVERKLSTFTARVVGAPPCGAPTCDAGEST